MAVVRGGGIHSLAVPRLAFHLDRDMIRVRTFLYNLLSLTFGLHFPLELSVV